MSDIGHKRPEQPQPLNYHRPVKQPRILVRTLYIVLLGIFVAGAILFGTCWAALH
jgi:hypothetical protein